jgi:hypothetical protein
MKTMTANKDQNAPEQNSETGAKPAKGKSTESGAGPTSFAQIDNVTGETFAQIDPNQE